MLQKNDDLRERARRLVSTSVEDMQSSLPYFTGENASDITVLEYGFEICEKRGEKTKANLLKSKIKRLKKEAEKKQHLELLQKARDTQLKLEGAK